jgi:hypothetical protein
MIPAMAKRGNWPKTDGPGTIATGPRTDAAATLGELSKSPERTLLADRSPATEEDADFVEIGPAWARAQAGLFSV